MSKKRYEPTEDQKDERLPLYLPIPPPQWWDHRYLPKDRERGEKELEDILIIPSSEREDGVIVIEM